MYPGTSYEYIPGSYIKYLEMSGARVIPIFYDSNQTFLDQQFSQINGLLFPGGDVDIEKGTLFGDNAAYLFYKALLANQQGDYFPIWGTCQGF